MSNKRYAIVRVDDKCPDEFEKIDVNYICRNISCYQGKECSKNFYGDTKEQLEKKIETIIRRIQYKISQPKSKATIKKHNIGIKYLAKEIVDFLGVEE